MKVHGYSTELIRVYNENVANTFQWGTFDCCIWTARVIDRITDRQTSILDGWEFDYSTKVGAFAYLAQRGYSSLSDLADNYFDRVDIKKSMRGDLVLADGFLTINYGSELVAVGNKGLEKIKLSEATVAWRVE